METFPELTKAYEEGATPAEVAALFEVPETVVRAILKANGVSLRRANRFSAEALQKARDVRATKAAYKRLTYAHRILGTSEVKSWLEAQENKAA